MDAFNLEWLKRQIFYFMFAVFLFPIVGYLIMWFVIVSTEPYKLASSYIKKSDRLRSEVGPIEDYRLAWWGFHGRINMGYRDQQYAVIPVYVKGSEADAYVTFRFEREPDWRVIYVNFQDDDTRSYFYLEKPDRQR